MGLLLPTLFDLLFWLVFAIVHVVAAAAGIAVYHATTGPLVWQQAGALTLAYVAFLHALVVVLVVLKRLFQPRLKSGTSGVGKTRGFVAWGLSSVFQGVFLASPFHDQIHFMFWLRYLYYRGMGMRLHPSVVLGTGAILRQVELLRVGRGSVIGIGAAISGHLNADGGRHYQAEVVVGERVLIGAHTSVGPGVVIGDGAVIGYRSSISINARVDAGAKLGVGVFVKRGVHIGEGARIAPFTVVDCDVPAGATWPTAPAEEAS